MKITHTQCRLDGAYADRGYYELHGLFNNPNDVVLNTALVGTIEFNGETCVGNIHWVSKSSSDGGELEYHMRRVFCFFIRGVSGEDFAKSRRTVRNFRAYFTEYRAEHLRKLQGLRPKPHPPNYIRLKLPTLVEELKKRKLSTKGLKADIVKRLEKDDADENTEALGSLIEAVGQSHMNSQGSDLARSFEELGLSNQSQFFHSQKRTRDVESADEVQSPSAQKRSRQATN
jgi:hypothetical protein